MSDDLPGRAAREWIRVQLGRVGRRVDGEMDEPRVRPWSTVVRIRTDDGAVWFKANRAQTTYEPALLHVLAEHLPQLVLQPIAIDVECGWSLLPDGGPILRSFPDDAVLRHWERLLPAYGELQQRLSVQADGLTALGVPDDRPEQVPQSLNALLDRREVLLVDEPGGLTTGELESLRALGPILTRQCDALAGSGVAPSVEHGDLHDGNVFVRDVGYAVFDWGDACIAHPFTSLLVTMSTISARYGMEPGAPALTRLRDAYLEPWTTVHPLHELVALAAVAVAVAPLSRARSWERALHDVPAAERGDFRDAVPGWLRELLNLQPGGG